MGNLIFTIMYGGSIMILGLVTHLFLNSIEKEGVRRFTEEERGES